MVLPNHTSRWSMDVYLAVDRQIAGAENTALSGAFFSKVYEGPFQNTRAWCKDFVAVVTAIGPTSSVATGVFAVAIGTLAVLAVVSLFTGFRIRLLPFRLCPPIFVLSAVPIALGAWL